MLSPFCYSNIHQIGVDCKGGTDKKQIKPPIGRLYLHNSHSEQA